MLIRRRLLERITHRDAQVVALYAPAGYGKTVLAQQIPTARRAVCDCKNLAAPWAFARAVVHAMSSLDMASTAALIQFEIAMAQIEPDSAAVDRVLEAWRGADAEYTFVFENAESLTAQPALVPMLERLLLLRGRRRVVICARSPLPLRLSRSASLENIVTLRSHDLQFTIEEIRELLGAEGASRAPTIERIARGWPILTQALKQAGPTDVTSVSLDGMVSSHSEIAAYLREEVIRGYDATARRVLIALSAIPNARPVDVQRALGDVTSASVERLIREQPFVTYAEEGAYEVHPLLAAAVRENHETECFQALRAAAEGACVNAEPVRQAELLCAVGDFASAASALDDNEVIYHSSPTPALAHVIASLPKAELRAHPALWVMALLLAVFTIEPAHWLREARYMWRLVRGGESEAATINVAAGIVSVLTLHGEYGEACAALDEACGLPAAQASAAASTIRFRRATIAAQRGQHTEAREHWNAVERVFAATDASYALAMYDIVARIARCRGERRAERHALREAFEAGERAQMLSLQAAVTLDSAFGAWFAGEEEQYRDQLRLLRRYLQSPIAPGIAHFVNCADGRHRQAAFAAESLKSRVLAYLIACTESATLTEAAWCAQQACEAAILAGQPFYQTLAYLAAAQFNAADASELRERARSCAHEVQSEPLHEALTAVLEDKRRRGLLEPFLSKLEAVTSVSAVSLHVSPVFVTVELQGRAVELTDRELELAMLLAVTGRPMTSREIAGTLYPDRDSAVATNAVKVYVNRLRRKFGKCAIVSTREGYALARDRHDDLLELENLRRTARDRRGISERRADIARCLQALDDSNRARMREWEWFAPVEARINDAARELRIALIEGALDCGENHDAKTMATMLVARDSCDEEARELLIRAYLAIGNEVAAAREYRSYREALARELDAKPGEHLARLFHAAVSAGKESKRA